MTLKTREMCDLDDPKEHLFWAIQHLPFVGGASTIMHPKTIEEWSEHFYKAGVFDVQWLIERFGRPDGTILISDLPEPQIKFVPPVRGPMSSMNPSSRWVPVDTPEPYRQQIPDLNQFTPQEVDGILQQALELGFISDEQPQPDTAEVE